MKVNTISKREAGKLIKECLAQNSITENDLLKRSFLDGSFYLPYVEDVPGGLETELRFEPQYSADYINITGTNKFKVLSGIVEFAEFIVRER